MNIIFAYCRILHFKHDFIIRPAYILIYRIKIHMFNSFIIHAKLYKVWCVKHSKKVTVVAGSFRKLLEKGKCLWRVVIYRLKHEGEVFI